AQRTGWFAEDFTWQEIRRLRRRERWPHLRPGTLHDDEDRVLSLDELLRLIDAHDRGPAIRVVVELKHSAHLRTRGLRLEEEVARIIGHAPVERFVVESFEAQSLVRMRELGFAGDLAFLVEATAARREALLAPPPA